MGNIKKEGWAGDISSHGKRHYYKDGVSLCNKKEAKPHMNKYDMYDLGDKYCKDCTICIKKRKELLYS